MAWRALRVGKHSLGRRFRAHWLPAAGGQSVAGPPPIHRNPVIPISIEALQHDEFYLRLQSQYSLTLLLYLHTQESLNSLLKREGWLFGAYIGFLAFGLLSNLFLFLTTRSRLFLSFCLLLITFHGGFFLSNFGITWQYLWHASPWWTERSILFLMELSMIFGNIFVTGSLGTKTYAPRLHRWLAPCPNHRPAWTRLDCDNDACRPHRGIGMYAVKRMIEDRGGSIRIVLGQAFSRDEAPFHFLIEIPFFRRAIREAA